MAKLGRNAPGACGRYGHVAQDHVGPFCSIPPAGTITVV